MVQKKIAIVGSRGFKDYELLKQTVNNYINKNKISISQIVSGGADGADSLAEIYAQEYKFEVKIHYPDWQLFGKKAGFIRNELIIQDADIVFAFWDGESKGTKSSINLAKEYNRELVTIMV